MFKNKNVTKFLIVELIVIVCVFVISTILSMYIFKIYSDQLVANNNKIIYYVTQKYPELEEEIIISLLEENASPQNFIEKYGIESFYIHELREVKDILVRGNILIIVSAVLISIIIFFIYIIREHRSLNKISNSINRALNNDYAIHLKEYEEGYISSLTNDVYKVIYELKEQRDLLQKDKKYLEDTLSDISHQLRTPLTSMYVINDLLDGNISEEKRHEFLNNNREQLERIEWLVTSLLKLSRLESGSVKLIPNQVNVKELIEKAIDPIRINLEIKEIQLLNKVDPNLIIKTDFYWTKEAIVNIIKNAYEHTPNGGHIEIEAFENPLYTQVSIKDTGCGIPKDKIPYIFDRFYKINKDSNSIGIGLNMTKRIINQQLGEIKVESTVGKGTTFIIKFYKNII